MKKPKYQYYEVTGSATVTVVVSIWADSKKNALDQLNGKIEVHPDGEDFGDQLYDQLRGTKPSEFDIRYNKKSIEKEDK